LLRGSVTSASCPANPAADGTAIFQQSVGVISCLLEDAGGFWFRFNGLYLEDSVSSGGPWNAVNQYSQFQINSSGKDFALGGACFTGDPAHWFWNNGDGFASPVISPTNIPSPFPFSIGASFFSSFQFPSGGQTENVGALQGGLNVWIGAGRITGSNTTISVASGGAIGCNADESNAIFPVDTSGGAISGTTVTGAGNTVSQVAYLHDVNGGVFRCINMGNGSNWTVSNLYIHDCDYGLQGNTTAGGTTGTITNVVWDHHGNSSSGGSSASHNVYLGGFAAGHTGILTVSGGGSYCTNGHDGGGPGFEFKTRWVGGTFQNWTAASPSQHGYTDCAESAAVDLSCGGNYTLGGTTANTGVVLEVDNGINGNGFELVRYGRDDTTGNCGAGSTPWSDTDCNSAFSQNCQLLIQNCWLINDSTTNIKVVTIDATIPANRVTVKNCKLVQGSTGTITLGTGVIDGGGNASFATRAAAGLSPYPALPSPP
jgi:hypothetical protein